MNQNQFRNKRNLEGVEKSREINKVKNTDLKQLKHFPKSIPLHK